ncbi:aspartate aminotransferase family protein [Agaricicola taiwanensis]|uniref:Aspartate aminotransferase family protein n=1 Tax=Agaricicola taiwanensis TaxID=591372 RepID=A0A8J3DYP8_9RHOB|nr:aspartate aminotransferase family protein [Agaricicola taiwanensis]GGE50327.1 aspartate aminotransferase family protein [Agaricicola taiwanensis]
MSMTADLAGPHAMRDNDYYGALLARAGEIEARYRQLTPKSAELFARAREVFPGGFTRDAVMRKPYAPFIASGSGSLLKDVDGRTVVDMWFNATSLPLGHAHPHVLAAAEQQLRKGTAYFGPTEYELPLAELLIDRLPSTERLRFANSGSEAVMMAVRFGRAFSKKPVVLKFEGSYHGSYDDVSWSVSPSLAQAGEIRSPIPVAESAGLAGTDGRMAVLPFNDIEALRAYVEAHHAEIGVMLVEPMANRIGLLMPDKDFLLEARALCDRHNIVLIFDEVIAFRVGYNGAQGLMGVAPDLTTLGKIIGGGFPVGAIAGRADVLDLSSPALGFRVTHAGTFNANPMVAVAGYATMERLTPEVFAAFNRTGDDIRRRLAAICEGLPLQVTGSGSLFKITATGNTIRNYRDGAASNKAWENAVSLAMLNEGFLMTPTLSGAISTVTTPEQIDVFIDAFKTIVTQ